MKNISIILHRMMKLNDKELKYECFKMALSSGVLTSILSIALTSFAMNIIRTMKALTYQNEIFILTCIVAPIIEEILKPLGLIFCNDPKEHLKIRDWAFLGVVAGTGFSILENSFYFVSTLTSKGRELAIAVIVFRTFTTMPMHMFASSLTGIGIGLWKRRRRWITPLTFSFSIIIHSSFNFLVISR